MVTPERVPAGEVWAVELVGESGMWVAVRSARVGLPWSAVSPVGGSTARVDDADVRLRHRLAPACPITRDDLPSIPDVFGEVADGNELNGAGKYREAVIERLNANGGAPVSMGRSVNNMLRETLANVERDRDRWRRAHGIVEAERDQAREERDTEKAARREAWKHLDAAADRVVHEQTRAEDAERERDEWKAGGQEWELLAKQERARAEAAEARTAPAVSRTDVEKAITVGVRGTTDGDLIDPDTSIPSGECVRLAIDAVCRLFGVEAEATPDPVEELAGHIDRAVHEALAKTIDMIAVEFGVQAPMHVEDFLPEAWDEYRYDLARHVLGSGADDE